MNLKLPLLYLPDKAVLKDMVTRSSWSMMKYISGRVTGNVDTLIISPAFVTPSKGRVPVELKMVET